MRHIKHSDDEPVNPAFHHGYPQNTLTVIMGVGEMWTPLKPVFFRTLFWNQLLKESNTN